MTDWYVNNFKSKGHLEHRQGPTLPYVLELHRIEGLSKLKNSIEISILLYDAVKCCCYGSMWKSLSIPPPFNINQELVFHSDITASTILLLEIVQIDAEYTKTTLGWTCFNLLDRTATNKKHNIYHGSARALFYLQEPSVASSQLLRYEGVSISLSLAQRNMVRDLTSHIPPNYFHPPAHLNKINKTMAPISIFLENVEVSFGAHIQKFEDNLLFLLMNDAKQQNTNIRQFDKVTIKERRLKASIHNGLNFTDQFQVAYLENIHNMSLKSKGVISLTGVDPRNTVIFSLEYVLEVPTSFTNLTLISSMRQSQVHIVTLRWGVWSLSKNLPPSGSLLNVPISGGPGLNPEKKLVFTSDFGPMETSKEAAVMFKLIKQEADVTYLSRDTLDATYPGLTAAPELDVTFDGGPRRSLKSTDTQPIPTIEIDHFSHQHKAAPQQPQLVVPDSQHKAFSSAQQPIEPLVGENMAHFDIKPSFQQDIRPQDIEKAAYAQIHNAGFPDIVDSDGRPAMELDLSKHYVFSPALEKNDSRTCNNVVFQFQAVSFNTTPVRNMFFTVQFYCFVAETSPVLTSQQAKPNLPAILYKQQNSDHTPGCNISFTVDPGKLANEPNQFLSHIQTGACIIDMWNADSLFHVGSVNVKLKRLARQGEHGIQSTQVFNILRDGEALGKLHLRVANVGAVPSVLDNLRSTIIVDCVDKSDTSELIVRPKPLSNVDQNLTSILSSETVQKAARNRKVERMEAVRRAQDASYIIPRDEGKELRAGQLTMIKNYRNKILNDVIRQALVSKITRHHNIHTVYGSATYFEVHICNDASAVQDFYVTWDATDIRLVYDTTECKALKSLFNVTTPIDLDVFTSSTQPAKLTLRPNEDIYIPFVYSSNATKDEFTYTMKICNYQSSPVHLIKLHFKQQHQIIHEKYMFYEAENSFAKHSLPLAAAVKLGKLKVKCSEESVLCGVDNKNQVYFKAPVRGSTEKMTFLLLLYVDEMCYRPYQIWEVELYSLKRVDMSAVVGSQSRFPVILRGTDATRCVTCFSSTPDKIQVEPDREFMLLPSTIQEVKLLFEPTETGVCNYMVNVVDTKNKVLVEQWMVHTSASLPVVSKTYDIPVSTTLHPVHKNISFTNPYTSTKTFKLKTNKPELVQFKDNELSVPSKESVNIGLVLSPICLSQSNYILVFVNDVDQKCEECFALRIG